MVPPPWGITSMVKASTPSLLNIGVPILVYVIDTIQTKYNYCMYYSQIQQAEKYLDLQVI